MGRALGHESDLTATVFSLRDKPAPYPGGIRETSRRVDRPKRALIARVARAASNCGAIATLSRFLNNATLWGGLVGRMPRNSTNGGLNHDHR
jgi:hypothetical protein